MIREFKAADKGAIESILMRTPSFSPEEVDIAMELVYTALKFPMQKDYIFRVYEEDGVALGYYCLGPRALTEGTYDLYWIVVDPLRSGRGIGSELLMHAEELIRSLYGRLLLIETSSREDYTLTRSFYIKHFYDTIAVIRDFYRKGDDLVVYGKYVT